VKSQTILYISYDGMLEPLGQSQVLAYLKKLAPERHIHLISYEKHKDWKNRTERDLIAHEIAIAGIFWHPLRYHKWPSTLATALDIAIGTLLSLWLVVRYRLKIIHARSYVPSVIALTLKSITGVKYIFDMRGFWADEKVDGDVWPRNGFLYCVAKKLERYFFLGTDHLISLTQAGVREVKLLTYMADHMPPCTVIPTCADLRHFCPTLNSNFYKSDSVFVLGYVGSIGTYYMFEEVISIFILLLIIRPNARLLIVNRDQHELIRNQLIASGISDKKFDLISASHLDVPMYMSRMDAGVFFIKPVFSKQASAPTKLAEFLGCGIPCISNAGVGDLTEVLDGERVGVAIRSFESNSMTQALHKIFKLIESPEISSRCVSVAEKYFSLDMGVSKYSEIYDGLSSS